MKLFTQKNRLNVFNAIVLVTVVVIIARLFQLQVIDHRKYTELAYQEQVKKMTIPAKRGFIYALDQNQPIPLVMNETVYTVFADPQAVKSYVRS